MSIFFFGFSKEIPLSYMKYDMEILYTQKLVCGFTPVNTTAILAIGGFEAPLLVGTCPCTYFTSYTCIHTYIHTRTHTLTESISRNSLTV